MLAADDAVAMLAPSANERAAKRHLGNTIRLVFAPATPKPRVIAMTTGNSSTSPKGVGIIGVGIIGLGTVGRRFVEQFQRHRDFALIAGADADPRAASAAGQDFSLRVIEAAELIEDPAVELVYIAVPPLHHEPLVDAVVEAGKIVFCEKPLGVHDDVTAALVQRVHASGAKAAVNFVFGGAPGAQELIRRSRAHGADITSAELRLHFCRWPRDWQANATWLRDRDQGGWIREVVSHYVFLMHRAFGPPTVTTAEVLFAPDGSCEHSLVAALRCGDTPVRISASSDASGVDEVEFTVRSRSASLRLTDWYDLTEATSDQAWNPALDQQLQGGAAAYASQLDQLALLCRNEPHSLATFEEAFAVQRVVERLLVATTDASGES